MSKVSQRQAVYNATHATLKDAGVDFEDGSDIKDVITTEHRTSINAILCEGFLNNTVELKDTPANAAKLQNTAELKKYVSGLMSNWFRKDLKFNGGAKYVPTNPGSRTGQSDSTMKNLRLLKKQYEAAGKNTVKIQEAIEKRSTELKASKVKDVKVDMNAIPAELKETLGIE